MRVRVRLFAVAKELTGCEVISVDVPAIATLVDVQHAVAAAYPVLNRILSHAMWAVDAEYANHSAVVNEQSDIALIPPVSGG